MLFLPLIAKAHIVYQLFFSGREGKQTSQIIKPTIMLFTSKRERKKVLENNWAGVDAPARSFHLLFCMIWHLSPLELDKKEECLNSLVGAFFLLPSLFSSFSMRFLSEGTDRVTRKKFPRICINHIFFCSLPFISIVYSSFQPHNKMEPKLLKYLYIYIIFLEYKYHIHS